MSTNDIHGIESGWSVKTRDGEDIGNVEEANERFILVKSGLLTSEQRYFPSVTLAHVRPELKEIGISVSKEEVDGGDWSTEPTELPRTEGAPLNEGEEDVLATDPLAAVNREPEKPTTI
jgi:hypothetical protein